MTTPPDWTDDELRRVLGTRTGAGADADLPDDQRFFRGVAKLLLKRLDAAGDGRRRAPALFVLFPLPPDTPGSDEFPVLNTGSKEVEGSIWFTNPMASWGMRLSPDHWTDAAVFNNIRNLGAADAPAVFFEDRVTPPLLRFFPKGISLTDTYEELYLTGGSVTLAELVEHITWVYQNALATPQLQRGPIRWWVDPPHFVPVKEAEKVIASVLRISLMSRFRANDVHIADELWVNSGRLDLLIRQMMPGTGSVFRHTAVLELKVLRSLRSSTAPVSDSDNAQAIVEGVQQAAAYKDAVSALGAALCCFDMRRSYTGDACFDPVRADAAGYGVLLKIWFLFNSASAMRRHRFPVAPSSYR